MKRSEDNIDYCTNCFEGIIEKQICLRCRHEFKLRIMKDKTMTKVKRVKNKLIPAIRIKEVTDALK